jgi:prepilin-type processing-associated H-X9-DG protein
MLLKPTSDAGLVKYDDGGYYVLVAGERRYLQAYPASANNIGMAGTAGFGVGICPPTDLPTGFTPLAGHADPTSGNYGNYVYADGSVMCWVPKFYYKIGTGANGFPVNWVDIKPASAYADTAAANAAGYALHRAFIDGGVEKSGFFFDKYPNSKAAWGTGYIGSSIKNGLPLSTHADHNPMWKSQIPWTPDTVIALNEYRRPTVANGYSYECTARAGDFKTDPATQPPWPTTVGDTVVDDQITWTCRAYVGLTACGSNAYFEAIKAAHARDGVNGAENASSMFAVGSRFQYAALALLSQAHGLASKCEAWCAWYDWTGAKNYPKGCNNNALRDTDDATVVYLTDGYSNCGKAGSGFPFAKTTHNGQECGIADLNGLMYEISLGMTCVAAAKNITGISEANPAVVTIVGHGYVTGDLIQIDSVAAPMAVLNGKIYTIIKINDDTFSLTGANTTATGAWVSGGTATKGTFYAAKTATAMKSFTSGNSAATDHWGATGVAAMMDAFVPVFVTSAGGVYAQRYGNAFNQVLAEDVSGADYLLAGLGLPFAVTGLSPGGDNLFGKDYFYQYIRNELCPISCAHWADTSYAGVWALAWHSYRTYSSSTVGWRCACFPV